MTLNNKTGLIVGIGAAAEHLGVSVYLIRRYISLGMPCGIVETDSGRYTYHFHSDNLENFWRESTKKPLKIQNGIIEDETIEKNLVKKNRGQNVEKMVK